MLLWYCFTFEREKFLTYVSLQVSDFLFDAQRKTFHTKGYAEDPTAYADKAEKSYVGAVEKAVESDCRTVFEEEAGEKKKKRKREHFGDPSDPDNYKGPWASYVDEVKSSGPTEEERAMLDSWAARKEPKANAKPDENEKTILHIEDTHDYQGEDIYKFIKPNYPNDVLNTDTIFFASSTHDMPWYDSRFRQF